MAEEGTEADASERRFSLRKIYLKDVSFESPAAPSIFAADVDVKPQMNLQLSSEAQRVADDQYEVVLALTVTATIEEKTAFLVELKQAGLFRVAGFSDDERSQLLGISCPDLLFPFAREAVAELVQKGGMPQLLLQPINFDALYQQQVQRREAAADAPETTQ